MSPILKIALGFVLVFAVACGSSKTAEKENTEMTEETGQTNEQALAQIDAYMASPSKETGQAIIDMMVERKDVMVVINEEVYPPAVMSTSKSSLLLAAFVAGNMRAQLESGTKGDSPDAGIAAMKAVYQKLKADGQTETIEHLESAPTSQPTE